VLIGIGAWHFTSSQPAYSGTSESITIGGVPYDAAALIYIAEDKGLFDGNGLNVTMQDYDSAPSAIDGLLNDEADMALISEYVAVGKAFKKENISVIGIIDKYHVVDLVARKDKGIESVSDLKGKKIGVTRRSQAEFYLGRFLNLHGISLQDITLVDLSPPQYVQALTNGSVDAIIAWDLYIGQIQERSGSNIVIWPAQNSQSGYYLMACRDDWAAGHPETINRFLKSIAQAEEYAINYPDEAKAILQKKLNNTDAYMATIWPNHQFSLSLDQSLLIAMPMRAVDDQ
jgi:NitT/TauT family transport system substrate-binding protein